MSPTSRDAVKYSGIITGIPFMTIAGFYVGKIAGESLGPPWTDLLPIIGGLSFFLLIVVELALLESRAQNKQKGPGAKKKINLPDYTSGINIRSTFKLEEDENITEEENP
ncbi:MAG: hypothetical protein ACFFD4_16125 [Candidatus Odinarchaeota archaeon]